nr:ATP-binding protein [Vallitalea okinawensis]
MKSIKWRLVVLYVTLISIVMIICGTFIVSQIKSKSYGDKFTELERVAERRITLLEQSETIVDDAQVAKNMKDTYETSVEYLYATHNVYVKKIQGSIIYPDSVDLAEEVYKEYNKKLNTIAQVKSVENGQELTSIIEVDVMGEVGYEDYAAYATTFDLDGDGTLDYTMYVETSLEEVNENLSEYVRIIIISVIISVVISAVLGFLFANTITRPIAALTRSAKKMAKGNISHENNVIEVKSDDEIGQLTETFNHMAIELNKTLSAITSEKNKLETVFAHMADGILVFNSKNELIHANPAAYSMLGLKIADKPFGSIFEPLDSEINFESLLEMDTNSLQTFMLAINDQYINACFATYIDKSNESFGLITVLQDMTEQKKLEEMQKEFVANVSHELRTPLTTIKSYTETLLAGALDERDVAENFLQVVNNESDRMTTLVKDLLELSRLDNKQIKFNMKTMDLSLLMEDCYDKYKILADKKNQQMVFANKDDKFHIIGDAHRIEQVIKNIISNAVKYSPEDATIKLNMRQHFDMVQIIIEDDGLGIPEEDLPRIFERFYRVDKARSRAMGGTGLGLAIVKEIVEHHGGHITVDSVYGKGSTFCINLPIRDVI